MRACIKHIEPNDTIDWDTFASQEVAEPWDGCGWFTIGVGIENEESVDYFQVAVATPTSRRRMLNNKDYFQGILVDSFEPDIIKNTLTHFVENIKGGSWSAIVDQLRPHMLWEYEGMGPESDR